MAHARYVTFQLTGVAVPRGLFRAILYRIRVLGLFSPPVGSVLTGDMGNTRAETWVTGSRFLMVREIKLFDALVVEVDIVNPIDGRRA